MATVKLRSGDTLEIIWTSLQETPFGSKEVESSFSFSYDELLTKLKAKGQSRRSGTDGARFSRVVALATNALKKGKWSTGAEIDREEVMSRFNMLKPSEYKNITSNARKSLYQLLHGESVLTPEQLKVLKNAVDAIGL